MYKNNGFSGNKDIDYKILLDIDDISDLLNLCSVNKYMSNLCNEDFWKKKTLLLDSSAMEYKTEETWKEYFLEMVKDLDQIKTAMISEIKAMLTIGRGEEGLTYYTEKEIQEFISENVNKLDTVVQTMYFDYRNEGELSDLRHAQLDWYREYLFESFPVDMFYEDLE